MDCLGGRCSELLSDAHGLEKLHVTSNHQEAQALQQLIEDHFSGSGKSYPELSSTVASALDLIRLKSVQSDKSTSEEDSEDDGSTSGSSSS